jgi:hypothetical protein
MNLLMPQMSEFSAWLPDQRKLAQPAGLDAL